jgi:CxxC motif-containing protein (DUF1111 family)
MSRAQLAAASLLLGASIGLAETIAPAARTSPWMSARRSGGKATVDDDSRSAFTQHAPEIALEELPAVAIGNRIFSTPWVEAPSSVDRFDGLGPLFSSHSCSGCHLRDGRGRPPAGPDELTTSMIVKLARADGDSNLGPDPIYGSQLSERALQGLRPEGRLAVHWEEVPSPTGSSVRLRKPSDEIVELGYGPLAPETRFSPRIAPAVFGSGLLEAVPDSLLVAAEDPDDSNQDGISGRVHWVIDPESGTRKSGRFGWKATQSSVAGQVTMALNGDMGITTALRPEVELTSAEAKARARPNGGTPELEGESLDALLTYCRLLAVPARRDVENPAVMRGASVFQEIGCTSCHAPELTIAAGAHPALTGEPIHPYTDLLLHDLGPELADRMPEGDAKPSEWRTPPLWGLGLDERVGGHRFLLHDGRARTLDEAILWHGGEASRSRDAFSRLATPAHDDLLAFLESL